MQFVRNLAPLVIGALLVISLASRAQAASFDCSKASTPHEKHICADPVLDGADSRMGESYRATLRSFPVKGFVRASQQNFLIGYGFCGTPGGGGLQERHRG